MRHLCLTVIMILALLACPSVILANTTNAIPFSQSFEESDGYTNGATVVETEGWYHSDTNVAIVFTTNYEANLAIGATYPIASTTHSNVLKLTDISSTERLTNMVTGCYNSNIWVDFVINPVHWTDTDAPTVASDAQLAFYISTNGHLFLRHCTNTAPADKFWNEITDTSVSSTSWHRIILNIDYATEDLDQTRRYFTVKLNGTKITNQYAYIDNNWPTNFGGSWFCLGSGAITNMNSLSLSGNGYLDDLVITNENPNLIFWNVAVLSTYAGAAGIPTVPSTNSYSESATVNCAVTNSPVQIAANATQYVCTGWTGTGSASSSGSSTNTSFTLTTNSTVTWNWTTNYYLTTATNGSGTVTPSSGYYGVSNVAVTANAGSGYEFSYWSGNTSGCPIVGNVITAVMNQARSITANFSLAQGGAYGTPSAWFEAYGLTNYANWSVGETNDYDGDGKLNWEEYVTGTDPTNSASVFKILAQGYLASSNYVVWYGTTNSGVTTPFSIDRCTNLIVGWGAIDVTNVGDRSGTGTNTWWDTNAPASIPVFYRPLVIWTN